MNTYELNDKQYDVSKFSPDAQALFGLIVSTKAEAEAHQKQLTILTEAYNSFAVRLNALVSEDALIKPDQK